MSKIRNSPRAYLTRTRILPKLAARTNTDVTRSKKRERSYYSAPIDAGLYIDHRPAKK